MMFLIIILGTVLFPKRMMAQDAFAGTDFWICLIQNGGSSPNTQQLHLTAPANVTATVAIPGGGWSTSVNITAGAVSTINIPNPGSVNITVPTQNTVSKGGIHITAPTPVNVYASEHQQGAAEGMTGIPVASIGKEYIICGPNGAGGTYSDAAFGIVASENATTVSISLPAGKAVVGHAAGTSWTVILNQGETYFNRSNGTTGINADLTGVKISSDKPVAVTSGTGCANFPEAPSTGGYATCGTCDMLMEQLFPTNTWGTKYVLSEFLSRNLISQSKSSYVRVISKDAGTTSFSITGYPAQTLSGTGKYKDFMVTGSMTITSDKPVAAIGIMAGYNCYNDPDRFGDPSMVVLLPEEQWTKSANFIGISPYTTVVNVYAKSANPNVVIDGTPYNGFTQVNTSAYYYKSIKLPAGSHVASSASDNFMMYVYGIDTIRSYAYPAAGGTLKTLLSIDAAFNFDTACEGNVTHFWDSTKVVGTKVKTWTWDFGDGTPNSTLQNPTHTFSNAGNYKVLLTVTDTTGLVDTVSRYVVVYTNPVINLSAPTAICKGDTAQFSTANGAFYTWAWTGANLSATNIRNPKAWPNTTSTYKVQVKSILGCVKDTTFTVVVNGKPTAVISGNLLICQGDSTTLTASGGDSYTWQPGSLTTASIKVGPQSTTSYKLTVSTLQGCSDSSISATVTVNPIPRLSFSVTPRSCASANGSIVSLVGTEGTPAYSFSFDGGPFQNVSGYNNLDTGAVNVAVKDANGCSSDTTIIIELATPPNSMGISVFPDTCAKGVGKITINSVSGGTAAYEYSMNGGVYQSSSSFANLSPGSYTISCKDVNGCTADTTVNVGSVDGPYQILFSQTATACVGNTGTVTITGVSGGTPAYQYGVNGANFQTSATISNLGSGNVVISVKDAAGCRYDTSTTIAVVTGPVEISFTKTPSACSGNTGTVKVTTVTGGTAPYQYRANGGAYQMGTTLNGLGAGTATITVKDANGCTFDTTVSITNTNGPDQITFTQKPTACVGNTGSVTISSVSDGTPGYQYSVNGGVYQSGTTISGLAGGTISIRVKDVNGCIKDTSTIITVVDGPTDLESIVTPANCNQSDGKVTISSVIGGTAAYQYMINSGTYQSATTFTGLAPGSYTITVKDANGCTYSETVDVTNADGVNKFIVTVTSEACDKKNGQLEITGSSGGKSPYVYSFNGGTYQSKVLYTGLSSGSYSISVRDASGCTYDSVVNVSELLPPVPKVQSQQNAGCADSANGQATVGVTGNGPFIFSWNTNPVQTTATATGLAAGTWQCTVTDTNQCSATVDVNITKPQPLEVDIVTTPTACTINTGTAEATPKGGTAPYTYSWNTNPIQTTAKATGLGSSQVYIVTVRDKNNCVVDTMASISTLNGPQINFISEKTISCSDSTNGWITTEITGGTMPYSIAWKDTTESIIGTDSVLKNVGPGYYTLFVTDGAGCEVTYQHYLSAPPFIQATVISYPDACDQGIGKLFATASGGTGALRYEWYDAANNPKGTSSQLTNLKQGNYRLVVLDENGCSKLFDGVIVNNPAPVITQVSPADIHCEGDSTGSISATASGAGTLTYRWLNASTDTVSYISSVAGLKKGSYQLLVTDTSGCIADTIVQLTELYAIPVFNLGPDTAFCRNDSVLIGTTQPADNYLWNTGQNAPQIYVSDSGEYRLTRIVNGCSYTDTVLVREDTIPQLFLGEDSIFCGTMLITLNITINGQARYVWSDGSVNPVKTFTLPDEYWALISRNTCITSDTILFSEQPQTKVQLPNDTIICQGQSYTVVPQLTNAQDPQFDWNTSETTSSITVGASGEYIVTVSDKKCVASDTIRVTVIQQPVVDLGSDTSLCENESLTLRAGAMNQPFSKAWSTGEDAQFIQPVTSGIYRLRVNNQHCFDEDTIAVTFKPLPVFTLGTDTATCPGVPVELGVILNNGVYEWNTGAKSASISVSTPGTYIEKITIDGCSTSDTVMVNNHPEPDILIQDGKLCPMDTLIIDASTAGCSYLWENGDTTAIQRVTQAMVKRLTITNSFGCRRTKSVAVYEDRSPDCEPDVYVPNTFTPDGDGYNDMFKPVFRDGIMDQYTLSIYDRWGELIFQSSIPEKGWDGSFKSQPCQQDVYVWKLTYSFGYSVNVKEYMGRVALVR